MCTFKRQNGEVKRVLHGSSKRGGVSDVARFQAQGMSWDGLGVTKMESWKNDLGFGCSELKVAGKFFSLFFVRGVSYARTYISVQFLGQKTQIRGLCISK